MTSWGTYTAVLRLNDGTIYRRAGRMAGGAIDDFWHAPQRPGAVVPGVRVSLQPAAPAGFAGLYGQISRGTTMWRAMAGRRDTASPQAPSGTHRIKDDQSSFDLNVRFVKQLQVRLHGTVDGRPVTATAPVWKSMLPGSTDARVLLHSPFKKRSPLRGWLDNADQELKWHATLGW